MQEQLIRKVTQFGNGAHIPAPKEWLDEDILLVRPKRTIKEQIFKLILPHLENIIAVFLYGSHARNEQSNNSDIDVLIITNKKFKINSPNNFDIIVLEKNKIQDAIKTNPILLYSILKEAKPIINSSFLQELKKQKINSKFFNTFLKDTKELIKTNKELIELDKLEGNKLSSIGTIYSIILRLRGIFIINQLTKNKTFSNSSFKQHLLKTISPEEYQKVHEIYRAERDNKKTNIILQITTAEKLLNLLQSEIQKLK